MADTTEIVASATGLGAFLGGLFGAWKFRKPAPTNAPENGEPSMVERVAKLEQRADEADRREVSERLDINGKLDLLFAKADQTQKDAAKTQADVAEIKGMLNARSKPR